MAGITTALLIGSLALTAAGTYTTYKGQKAMNKAQSKAEDSRQAQMKIDAARQRREAVRQGIISRSQALYNAANQGADATGSSAIPGGYGQITGETGRQTLAVNQNEAIGQGIFAANKEYFSGSSVASFGQGMATLGQAVIQNLGPISRVGNYSMGRAGGGGGYVTGGVPVPGRNPFI